MKQLNLRQITLNSLFLYIIIFTTTTSSILNRVSLALVVGFGGLHLLLNGLRIKNNTFLNCMFFYGVFAFFAMFYSNAPMDKVSTVFSGYISMFIIVFFIVLVVEDENDIKKLLKAFAISSVIQCAYMLSVYGTDVFRIVAESDEAIRIGEEVSNSNSVGISFVLSSIISLDFLLNEKMKVYKKIFYGILVTIGVVFGLLSGSRKATILLVAGFFMIFLFKNADKKNIFKKIGGFVVAIVAVVVLLNLISSNQMFNTLYNRFLSLIDGLTGEAELDVSSKTRFEMIETGWRAFTESPLWGNGLYSSYNYFDTYSHNNFIEILMNTGLIGFVIFYYPYLVNIKSFIKVDKKSRMYFLMLILFLWIFVGGVGLVTYFSKDSMTLMAIISLWLSIKRREANEENNKNYKKS